MCTTCRISRRSNQWTCACGVAWQRCPRHAEIGFRCRRPAADAARAISGSTKRVQHLSPLGQHHFRTPRGKGQPRRSTQLGKRLPSIPQSTLVRLAKRAKQSIPQSAPVRSARQVETMLPLPCAASSLSNSSQQVEDNIPRSAPVSPARQALDDIPQPAPIYPTSTSEGQQPSPRSIPHIPWYAPVRPSRQEGQANTSSTSHTPVSKRKLSQVDQASQTSRLVSFLRAKHPKLDTRLRDLTANRGAVT